MTPACPDSGVEGFERAIPIAVGVEERAAWKSGAIVGNESGNIGMGAIPPEVIVTVVELELVGEAGAPGACPVTGDSGGVLIERRDEVRVGRPGEVGLFETVEHEARHEPVFAGFRGVVAALESEQTVDDDGRFDIERGNQCPGLEQRAGILREELGRDAFVERVEVGQKTGGGEKESLRRESGVAVELFE